MAKTKALKEAELMDKMLETVQDKTGHDIDACHLTDLLDTYAGQSSKKLTASLRKMIKGERGGENVETSAAIEEMEIVLAARTAFE